ncbi:MAG: DUF6616 family protein [Bacteroidota bacterium]
MIYIIEQWNAKPSWLALSGEERESYMNQVGQAIEELLNNGVKVLTWSVNDNSTSRKAAYDYFAIWSFPNQEAANSFQQLVTGAGWYNYFEQTNLMGKEQSAAEVIGKLISL